MIKKNTCFIVKSSRLVSCEWIFEKKEGIQQVWQGRFKAQLISQGFKKGGNWFQFSMVSHNIVKHKAVTILCAMVAEFDLELDYMDVKKFIFV